MKRALATLTIVLVGCGGSDVYDDSAPVVQDMAWRFCATTFGPDELPEPREANYLRADWERCLNMAAWEINQGEELP